MDLKLLKDYFSGHYGGCMNLIKILSYKGWTIKIFNNGCKTFPYEYTISKGDEVVKDRTSWEALKTCIYMAKQDIEGGE